jgi:calcineurin-like phosphoesterase family protein
MYFKEYFSSLKGKKYLVRGNHDEMDDDFYKDCGFLHVSDYVIYKDVFLSHYPVYMNSRWTETVEKEHRRVLEQNKCKTVIHGHIHNKNPADWESDGIQRINVSIDYSPNEFKPVQIQL